MGDEILEINGIPIMDQDQKEVCTYVRPWAGAGTRARAMTIGTHQSFEVAMEPLIWSPIISYN